MDKGFDEFKDQLFTTYLDLNPGAGSYLGLHQYDGKMNDVSITGIKKEIKIYKDFLSKLESVNQQELSGLNKYDYDIAKWGIESLLFEMEEIQSYVNDPIYYPSQFSNIQNYISREYAPFDDRLKFILSTMDKIPETLKTGKENLKKVLPEVLCNYARDFSRGYENFFKIDLLNVIRGRTTDENLINEYISKSDIAVNAFNDYISFLDEASSKEDNSYRLGNKKFEKMLSVKEHIEMPITELKKQGLEELKRLKDEMSRIIKENNFEGKLDTLEHSHPKEESLVQETNDTLNELVEFIRSKEIVDLPSELNCIVAEMPKYNNFGFAAMDTAGAFEKSTESYYYVNLPEQDWDDEKKEEWLSQFNYPTLKLISIHEAYPGHYTHFLNANKNSTKLSKIFMSYSYIEGWAHYTEEMMIEQGYGNGDFKVKIGMLLEALIRCCRYIVSIGIHCEGLTIDEAQQFFKENAFMADITALKEAERGAFDPGYLNYTLGKIFLKRFRDNYFSRNKNEKSLKNFHNQIVSFGAPTYRIAEKYIV